ncbi:uncharacterized protein LOC129356138 [Poeciliopsis prolifica]|uniref:uncharacterized protein LOC129356138 n=1 Tax=Poeciliopsis prolifica TaxID=188132 RepID=UPI0024146704|nr:uncharacterized protein LOC129356138 [Poeciliopsis prolifica]
MLNRTSSSLLVLILCSAALGKSLPTVNETLDVYEAEENSNITLKWIRPDPNATPPDRLYVDLMSMEPLRRIYRFDSRDETFTDDEFKGRLHCDPQLVRNGGIRCLLAEVRLSDAGRYRCYVVIDGRRDHRDWELVVRASIPQTQEETKSWWIAGGLDFMLVWFVPASSRTTRPPLCCWFRFQRRPYDLMTSPKIAPSSVPIGLGAPDSVCFMVSRN